MLLRWVSLGYRSTILAGRHLMLVLEGVGEMTLVEKATVNRDLGEVGLGSH